MDRLFNRDKETGFEGNHSLFEGTCLNLYSFECARMFTACNTISFLFGFIILPPFGKLVCESALRNANSIG